MWRTSIRPPAAAVLALLVLTGAAPAQDGPPSPPPGISIETLLAEGGDLRELASSPGDPYVLETYVRPSVPVTRKRGRRTEYVLARAKGPGAVVGNWLAELEGELRVYVDGSALPAIQVDAELALTGQMTLFPPPTAGRVARGGRLSYPIPYAKSVLVTCDRDVEHEVVCRRYTKKGAVVVPYDANAAARAFFTARESLATWADMPAPPPVPRVGGRNEMEPAELDVQLEPGTSHVVLSEKTEKPMAVTRLAVETVGDTVSPDTLALIRLKISFDGERCVDVALPELFGASRGFEEHGTLLSRSAIRAEGAVRWRGLRLPMPYSRSVEISVHHEGVRSAGLMRFHVERGPWRRDERTLHLHVRDRVLLADHEGGPWTAVGIGGSGVLVGLAMRVAASRPGWDTGPVTLEIGDASAVVASSLGRHFHAAPGGGAGSVAHVLGRVGAGRDFLRWRVLDRIPFTDGLRLIPSLRRIGRLRLAVTAFWYARPRE